VLTGARQSELTSLSWLISWLSSLHLLTGARQSELTSLSWLISWLSSLHLLTGADRSTSVSADVTELADKLAQFC